MKNRACNDIRKYCILLYKKHKNYEASYFSNKI